MPDVRITRKEVWRIALICLIVFLFSAGARLIEYPAWNQPNLQIDGERLLTTHDAYFWVAGAEGRNSISAPMPMSVLLGALSRIFPIPPANLAFWASALLAALVAIPTALWAYFLDAPYASFMVPVLGTLAPAFFNRTRLGYYDTDWATLFFPLLIGWLLAVWIQPRLRTRGNIGKAETDNRFARGIPATLIVLTAIGMPWHNSIGLFIIAFVGLAAGLVLLLGKPGTRAVSLLTLIALTLTFGAGWSGVLLGLLLIWWAGGSPTWLRHPRSTQIALVVLGGLLMAFTALRFQDYLTRALPAYLGGIFEGIGPEPFVSSLVYPGLAASVRETQVVNLALTLEGIAFHSLLAAAGVLGYLVLLRKKPAAGFLLPFLLLGLGALRAGVRFAIYATPAVLLGMFVPLDWYARQACEKLNWSTRRRVSIALLSFLLFVPAIYLPYLRLPVETVLGKVHAEVLSRLGEVADPEGTVWTWWDYGYASQHFSGLETFADGRRATGEYLFSLGTVLGADSFDRSAQFMRYAVSHQYEPWDAWETWTEAELEAWLDRLEQADIEAVQAAAPQYLVLPWEGIPSLGWIQYYGSWDFVSREGQHSRASKVVRPLELDLETGIFRFDDDQVLPAVTVDLLGGEDGQHVDYPANAGGPHILVNDLNGEVMLLDEAAYRSTFIQLLITPADQLEHVSAFRLLIDDQPFVRVYELQ